MTPTVVDLSSGGSPDASGEGAEHGHGASGGSIVIISFFIGLLSKNVLSRTKLPYTVILLLSGMLVGAIHASVSLGDLSYSINIWTTMDPHLLLFIFLPALIFESAFSVDYHVFKHSVAQMLLLAGPGVLISTTLVASFAIFGMGYDWDWPTGLTFGAMVSATDPVAVVALLQELGAPKQLSILIEGESLFNDGTALVIFTVFKDMMTGAANRNVGEIVGFFARLSIGGPSLGLAIGEIGVFFLGLIMNDPASEVTLVASLVYGTWLLAESTPLHVSGVLAVVLLGLRLSAAGKVRVSCEPAMHYFWETVSYLANTLVFILAGVVIVEKAFFSDDITLNDWWLLLALYVYLHVVRLVMLAALYPALARTGYGLELRAAAVLSWAGLRGAVGLALGLMVQSDQLVDSKTGSRMLFHVSGIAALTLLVNGTTTGALVRYLKLDSASPASRRMFENAVRHLTEETVQGVSKLRHSEFHAHADWQQVWRFMPVLSMEVYQSKMRREQEEAEAAREDKAQRTAARNRVWAAPFAAVSDAASAAARRVRSVAVQAAAVTGIRGEQPVGASVRQCVEDIPASAVAVELAETGAMGAASRYRADSEQRAPDDRAETADSDDLVSVASAGSGSFSHLVRDPSVVAALREGGVRLPDRQGGFGKEHDRQQYLREARHRFLNLIKANYWHQLESGFLSRTALTELIEAASSAQDDDSKCLDEWSRVAHHCKLPTWVQALNRVPLFGLLARRLINDHLAFALDVLTGFIQAHIKVEDHFRVLVQHKGAVAAILGESQRQLRRARGMLQSLSAAFPEISRSIVTKQAIRALLKNTGDLSHELLTHGEIEKKEYDRIQQGVYRAYKRLVTRPPVAAIPDPQQQLRDVEFLRPLSAHLFRRVASLARERYFDRGEFLQHRGDIPDGFFVVLRGTVKLLRRRKPHRRSLFESPPAAAGEKAGGERGNEREAGPGPGPRLRRQSSETTLSTEDGTLSVYDDAPPSDVESLVSEHGTLRRRSSSGSSGYLPPAPALGAAPFPRQHSEGSDSGREEKGEDSSAFGFGGMGALDDSPRDEDSYVEADERMAEFERQSAAAEPRGAGGERGEGAQRGGDRARRAESSEGAQGPGGRPGGFTASLRALGSMLSMRRAAAEEHETQARAGGDVEQGRRAGQQRHRARPPEIRPSLPSSAAGGGGDLGPETPGRSPRGSNGQALSFVQLADRMAASESEPLGVLPEVDEEEDDEGDDESEKQREGGDGSRTRGSGAPDGDGRRSRATPQSGRTGSSGSGIAARGWLARSPSWSRSGDEGPSSRRGSKFGVGQRLLSGHLGDDSPAGGGKESDSERRGGTETEEEKEEKEAEAGPHRMVLQEPWLGAGAAASTLDEAIRAAEDALGHRTTVAGREEGAAGMSSAASVRSGGAPGATDDLPPLSPGLAPQGAGPAHVALSMPNVVLAGEDEDEDDHRGTRVIREHDVHRAFGAGKDGSQTSRIRARTRVGGGGLFGRGTSAYGASREYEVVDTLGPGAVVGALAAGTSRPAFLSAIASTVVDAYFIDAQRFQRLMDSPDGGPLEESFWRMAGIMIADLFLDEYANLSAMQMKAMVSHTQFVRPPADTPIQVMGKALLLTGALKYVGEEEPELLPRPVRAFAVLEYTEERMVFDEDARLLVMPLEVAAMFEPEAEQQQDYAGQEAASPAYGAEGGGGGGGGSQEADWEEGEEEEWEDEGFERVDDQSKLFEQPSGIGAALTGSAGAEQDSADGGVRSSYAAAAAAAAEHAPASSASPGHVDTSSTFMPASMADPRLSHIKSGDFATEAAAVSRALQDQQQQQSDGAFPANTIDASHPDAIPFPSGGLGAPAMPPDTGPTAPVVMYSQAPAIDVGSPGTKPQFRGAPLGVGLDTGEGRAAVGSGSSRSSSVSGGGDGSCSSSSSSSSSSVTSSTSRSSPTAGSLIPSDRERMRAGGSGVAEGGGEEEGAREGASDSARAADGERKGLSAAAHKASRLRQARKRRERRRAKARGAEGRGGAVPEAPLPWIPRTRRESGGNEPAPQYSPSSEGGGDRQRRHDQQLGVGGEAPNLADVEDALRGPTGALPPLQVSPQRRSHAEGSFASGGPRSEAGALHRAQTSPLHRAYSEGQPEPDSHDPFGLQRGEGGGGGGAPPVPGARSEAGAPCSPPMAALLQGGGRSGTTGRARRGRLQLRRPAASARNLVPKSPQLTGRGRQASGPISDSGSDAAPQRRGPLSRTMSSLPSPQHRAAWQARAGGGKALAESQSFFRRGGGGGSVRSGGSQWAGGYPLSPPSQAAGRFGGGDTSAALSARMAAIRGMRSGDQRFGAASGGAGFGSAILLQDGSMGTRRRAMHDRFASAAHAEEEALARTSGTAGRHHDDLASVARMAPRHAQRQQPSGPRPRRGSADHEAHSSDRRSTGPRSVADAERVQLVHSGSFTYGEEAQTHLERLRDDQPPKS